jgi:hypothetical protein
MEENDSIPKKGKVMFFVSLGFGAKGKEIKGAKRAIGDWCGGSA